MNNNSNFPKLNRANLPEPVKKLPLPPKGGKVSGFPAPPKRPSTGGTLPPAAPERVYTPPARFPDGRDQTASVGVPEKQPQPAAEEKTLEEQLTTLVLSDEELQDVYDHRGARRVKFLPEEKIYILATSQDPVVRKELAINPDTPPNILKILSQDSDEQVREEVIFNPSTPKEIYATLVNDPSTWVIEALITNDRTPYSVLEKIDVGNDPYLKGLLAKKGI